MTKGLEASPARGGLSVDTRGVIAGLLLALMALPVQAQLVGPGPPPPDPSPSSSAATGSGGIVPTVAFELYLSDICFTEVTVITPLDDPLFLLCAQTFPGGGAGPAGIPGAGLTSTNLGSIGAQVDGALAGLEGTRNAVHARLGAAAPDGGASADWTVGRLSLFAAVQTVDTDRDPTALEQGYNSDSGGVLTGLDYRLTDSFTAGVSAGFTRSESNFDGGGGSLQTSSYLVSAFASWLPTDNISVGGYLGYSSQDNDSVRVLAAGPISGNATADFDGDTRVAGLSAGYDWYLNRSSVGAFVNLDYYRSESDGYTESGLTGLEMIFNSQKETSFTSTVGVRGSHSFPFKWGSLTPTARLAWVHEFDNDARTLTSALALAPDIPFVLRTDSPDRNYYTGGVGVAAELNAGPVLFADYERWGGHDLYDNWSLNFGALIPF